MNNIKRDKCVVCCGNLVEIHRLRDFPVFMGTVTDKSFVYEDMIFGECSDCGIVQQMLLIDPNVLYQNNHNIAIVGKMWQEHNTEFANFISKNDIKNVLEIGDPSFKISSIACVDSKIQQWTVVQPNITAASPNIKIKSINGFFENVDVSHIKIDSIVASHCFEHFYNPLDFFRRCANILGSGDSIFISVPNMEYIRENRLMSPLGMHFEHTFFLDTQHLEYMANDCGFGISEEVRYKNHSVFYKITKLTSCIKSSLTYDNKYKNSLISTYDSLKSDIDNIKSKLLEIKPQKVFLYGASIYSQLLLHFGLNDIKIDGVLDNAPDKHAKYLYGYDYIIKSPNDMHDIDDICVVVRMGAYTDEIKFQLTAINKEIRFV